MVRYVANTILIFSSLGLVFFLYQSLSGGVPDIKLIGMAAVGAVLAYLLPKEMGPK